jgi:hypothetical protein
MQSMLPSAEASFIMQVLKTLAAQSGLQEAVSIAANAYEEVGAAEKFMVTMQTNVF